MGLQHEGIAPAYRLVESHEDLPVGEIAGGLGGHVDIEFLGDLLGQLGVRSAGEEHQVLAVVGPVRAHCALPSPVGGSNMGVIVRSFAPRAWAGRGVSPSQE